MRKLNIQENLQLGFSEPEISLLEKIFVNNLSAGTQLSIKRFRVQNHEHLELLDLLLQNNYITQIADKYYLKIEALLEIGKNQPEAKRHVEIARQLFLLLQQEYRDDPEKDIPLNELSEKIKQSREDLNVVLSYLVEAPGIIGGRTTDLTQNDAVVCPAESILKYKSLDDFIVQIHSWRQSRNIEEHRAINFVQQPIGDFSFLLHEEVIKHALAQYQHGHLRDAVLNSMVAVFDYIRKRTGLRDDGDRLIGKAFSLQEPYLILSEIETESGKSDQKGFIQIFAGAYLGIRNPKAHTLEHDLTPLKAAQYLVFASMLIRRVEEATLVAQDKND